MSVTSGTELIETYAAILEGFGLPRSDLPEPHDGDGDLCLQQVAEDLRETSVASEGELYDCLRRVLARSARGIEAPRQYWSEAPQVQLSEVLEPLGYDVHFEGTGEEFEIVLEGDENTGTRRTSFAYPDDDEFGTDNYPALLHAVESRLLPKPSLEFVRLAEEPGDRRWRFVLVELDSIVALRERFGHRIEVFDRPLLAPRQPADFVFEEPAGEDTTEHGDVPVDSFEAMDDHLESIRKTAATEPVFDDHDGGSMEIEELLEMVR